MQMYLKTMDYLTGKSLWVCLAVSFFIVTHLPAYATNNEPLSIPGELSVQQPRISVSGIVLDEKDNPMTGVAVYATELAIGVSTNSEGRYSITVPQGTALTYSFLGYVTIQRTAGQQTINVKMELTSETIEDVVVVGYGTQKKVTVTGAVSSVGTAELTRSTAPNVGVALAGQLPGLTVIQGSGQPGMDNVEFYLRGQGSINDSSPLILVDGITRSNISTLDPNEIESITTLKDASATAVFGVRGANGVILITTRRGKIGKPELSVNFDQSYHNYTVKPTRIHSWEFAELINQAYLNDNPGESVENAPYSRYQIDKFRSGEDPVFFPDNDRYGNLMRNWAPQTRVNINFNGGTDKMQYFLNAGYLNQQGNFKTQPKSVLGYDPSFKLDRFTFRANVDYKFTQHFKAFINLGTYLESSNMPYDNSSDMVLNTFQHLYSVTPGTPGPLVPEGMGFPAGVYVDQKGLPEEWINGRGYTNRSTSNLNSTLGLELDMGFITEGLTTSAMISYDNISYNNLHGSRGANKVTFHQQRSADDNESSFTWRTSDANEKLTLAKQYESKFYMNMQFQINYSRAFGLHDVSGMFIAQRDNWDNWGADIAYNMVGIAARATYSYDYRYLAEVNFGYNGSEQFAKGNRFGSFPAFSVGWVASNEKFLKNNPVVTNLKLRASYGKVGNDKLGNDRFLYLDNFSIAGGGPIGTIGRGNYVNLSQYANTAIQWETAWKQNYGIDIQLFRELSLTGDVFKEKRSKILIRPQVAGVMGVPSSVMPKMNKGIIDNRGFELELRYVKKVNQDLTVQVKGNYSYNRNKWLNADEPELSYLYAYRTRRVGYSVGQDNNFGYVIDMSNGNGYINTDEELQKAKEMYMIGEPRLGDFKYRDLNGDGVIDEKDLAPIGYTGVPRINYGFQVGLNYKNFDFNVLFNGVAKTSKYLNGRGVFEFEDDGFFTNIHKNAWTEERFLSGSKITYPALSRSNSVSHTKNSFFIMDRSFLRLRNIELGYTLPARITEKISISRLRIYAGGQNLFMWNKLPVNTQDPEMNETRQYPLTRMVNFGLNISF